MKRTLLIVLVMAGSSLASTIADAAAEFKIVTASTRGTYIQIGRDIASFVAPQADIDLEETLIVGATRHEL